MGPAPPGILSSISTENMETTSITEDPFGGIDTSQPFNEMDFMKSWEGLDEDEPKLDDVEWTPPIIILLLDGLLLHVLLGLLQFLLWA